MFKFHTGTVYTFHTGTWGYSLGESTRIYPPPPLPPPLHVPNWVHYRIASLATSVQVTHTRSSLIGREMPKGGMHQRGMSSLAKPGTG